ncbi:MAG: helix-turn-helix transcriptional regulator [Tenericutes bacterium]|nr:helix-turn-helix transcriptional regulator [Bacilli bacterium]MDD4831509.1 helix-turn-helix transcriptional regulator [Bacilli bacterium]NLV90103.1 helix-turn-helix transcriptional regulator [Mycoplasmatota bacterium]
MIVLRIDRVLADRKKSSKELSKILNITEANFSILKNGKSKSIMFDTLNTLCKTLECQPKDLIEYIPDFED